MLFIFASCSFQPQAVLAKYLEGNTKGTFHFLKPEYAYLFIAYGNIVSLPSGVLEAIRFKGNYGPKSDTYKCHWQITNPGSEHQSTADRDCPLDSITSLIQNFFPSPVGEPPLTSNISGDFISTLKPQTLGRIIHFITKNKMNQDVLSTTPDLALEIYQLEYPDSYTNSVTKYQEQVKSKLKKAHPPAIGSKKSQKDKGKQIGALKSKITKLRTELNQLTATDIDALEIKEAQESLRTEISKLESELVSLLNTVSNEGKQKKAQLAANVSPIPVTMTGLIPFIESGQNKDFARALDLAKILTLAVYETQHYPERYPPYIVEHTLLAFFWNRFSTKDDLLALYQGMGPEMINAKWDQDHHILVDESWANTAYSFEDYANFKQKLTNPTPDLAASLLKNFEFFMFLTMAFNLYESQFPPMMVTDYTQYPAPNENIPDQEIESYKDCGESSLRNFFNSFAYNVNMGGIFDLDRLKRMFPNLREDIIDFFSRQTTGNLEKMRAEWGTLVANAPGASYCHINKKGLGYEINHGLANMLTVIRYLVNDPELNSIAEEPANVNESIHPQLVRLCQMLSQAQPNMKVTYNLSDTHDRGDMYLTFSINGNKTYTWTFLGDHFAFRPFNEGSANDWRNTTSVWQEAILHSPDLMTKGYATLLPLFMKNKDLFYSYTKKHPGLAALNIYTMPLTQLKDQFAALAWGFKTHSRKDLGLEALAHRWVENMPIDSLGKNDQTKIACLMSSYGTRFNPKNFPQSLQIAQDIENKAGGEWSQELSLLTEELTLYMPMCLPLFKKIVAHNTYENIRTKQPFFVAVRNDDLELAKILTDKIKQSGLDINTIKNISGHTMIDEAIDNNALKIVEFLLQNGVDVNGLDSNKMTPLLKALDKSPKMVVLLLKEGAKVNETGANEAPILKASYASTAFVVDLLLKNGASKDAVNASQNTPLHLASEAGKLDIVTLLLNAPYDVQVDPLNINTETPLHLASQKGHVDVINTLMAKGANVNAVNIFKIQTGGWGWGSAGPSFYGETPLHLAAKAGKEKAVEALLANPDTLVNKVNGENETALHLALRHRSPSLIKLLLDHGADPSLKNNNNKNALEAAKGIFNNEAVAQVLEQRMSG